MIIISEKIYITKRFEFEAAHHLEGHQGKCKNLHGHGYVLEVTLYGSVIPGIDLNNSMVIDFYDFKTIVNKIIDEKYDHKNLDEFFKFPTAECMAIQLFKEIKEELKNYSGVQMHKVRLYETSGSCVDYYGGNEVC